MNILSYLMESRGPINAMHRLPKIAQRFGVSPAKIERALDKFVSISERYGCTPTLTVTAAVLARNERFFLQATGEGGASRAWLRPHGLQPAFRGGAGGTHGARSCRVPSCRHLSVRVPLSLLPLER